MVDHRDPGPVSFDAVVQRADVTGSAAFVELGPDLTAALSEAGLLKRFREMFYSHQREYAQWIDEARRSATRQSRISRTVDRVRDGLRLK